MVSPTPTNQATQRVHAQADIGLVYPGVKIDRVLCLGGSPHGANKKPGNKGNCPRSAMLEVPTHLGKVYTLGGIHLLVFRAIALAGLQACLLYSIFGSK